MRRWGLPGTAVLQPAQTQPHRSPVSSVAGHKWWQLVRTESFEKDPAWEGGGAGASVIFDPIPVIFPCV